MKARTISLCISTALLVSFSSSSVFADVSPVADRGDLIVSDTIIWNLQSETPVEEPLYLGYLNGSTSVPNVLTTEVGIAVSHRIDTVFDIVKEPSVYFRYPDSNTNFVDDEYLLSTFACGEIDEVTGQCTGVESDNFPNIVRFVFSDPGETEGICGFGTQIAPVETGAFNATIQAFDSGDPMGSPYEILGSNLLDDEAAFLGLTSTIAMPSVEIVVTNTVVDPETGSGSGGAASWYAINQVTLTYCRDLPTEPGVPTLRCEGFAAPMANYPVRAKKNRVFPLKMELFDEYDIAQTDVELVAAPVVNITFTSVNDETALYTDGLLPAGHGSDGNMFDFTDDETWQFNLKSKGLQSGTYEVTVGSGDIEEYLIDTSCETSFTIK